MEPCLGYLPTLISNKRSDKQRIQFITGNSRAWPWARTSKGESAIFRPPRVLVEEAASVDIGALQRRLGKKFLLAAIRDARPVRCQVASTRHEVYLTYDLHRMPGGIETIRLWLVCLKCRRKFRRLYLDPHWALSDGPSSLGCRKCQGLRYLSQNSWNRKWWRSTAMPLKRMMRRRQKLLRRKQSPRTERLLEEVDEAIKVLLMQEDAKERRRRRIPYKSGKRTYCNLKLAMM